MNGEPHLTTPVTPAPFAGAVVPTNNPPPPPAPSDPVLNHYTTLFETLLRSLDDLVASASPGEGLAAIDGDEGERTWAELRTSLRAKRDSPALWIRRVDSQVARQEVQALLRRFETVGAVELARGCVRDGAGEPEQVWGGAAEVLSWLTVVKSVLSGELPAAAANTGPDLALAAPPMQALRSSSPPASLSLNGAGPSSSFGFPPSSLSTLTGPDAGAQQHMFVSPAEVSRPAHSGSPPAQAPLDLLGLNGQAGFAQSELSNGQRPAKSSIADFPPPPAPTPPLAGSSKAAALAARMSGLATSSPSVPVASTSTSPGFAPPPANGLPKPKKKRSSTSSSSSAAPKPPKRTSLGVLKAKGASEVYVPPEVGESTSGRPQRKRKLPKNLTFEQSSDTFEEEEEPARAAKKQKGKGKAVAPPPAGEEEEIDELASDYEEQLAARSASATSTPGPAAAAEEVEEEGRFKVGEPAMVRFPNYSWFPAVVLDPRTAPPKTQGKRVKGAYLVKSIPSGADHRWVPPQDTDIRPILPAELAEIDAGVYKVAPPSSWIKWRPELLEAVMMVRDPEALRDWLSRPTDLEIRLAAEQERKRLAKATAAW